PPRDPPSFPTRRSSDLHAERARVERVGADLVRAQLRPVAVPRGLEVGVAGEQRIAAGEEAPVGAAGRALPLALGAQPRPGHRGRSEEHTSELQSLTNLV